MSVVLERTLHGQWLNSVLVGAFAAMALLSATAGLYGVVSYLTAHDSASSAFVWRSARRSPRMF